ncbi:MAG: hypothetical protein ACM3Q2_10100 [Syntrophothermus sp.]
MTENELIKLKMYEALLELLYDKREIVSSIRAFNWSISKLRRICLEIRKREKNYYQNVVERNSRSESARNELTASVTGFTSELQFYTLASDDAELKGIVFVTRSLLSRLSDYELLARAEMLVSFNDVHLSDIERNSRIEEALSDLKSKTSRFRAALLEKHHGQASPDYILAISNLFAEADKLIRLYMDNFAEALSYENPDFYEEYTLTRNLERMPISAGNK